MTTLIAVLALSKRNSNAAEIILYLHRLTQVLVEYFKELEEESIRDNFVIIYELLDEMMDFGFPQTTESKILQEYVACCLVQTDPLLTSSNQVHHSRVAQARDTGTTSPNSHECRVVAVGRNTLPKERGVLGCY